MKLMQRSKGSSGTIKIILAEIKGLDSIHKVLSRKILMLLASQIKEIPYLGLHNAHPLLALKISRKKLVPVYNVHGLLKKIIIGNVRIKYQSYIFFSRLSMFHMMQYLTLHVDNSKQKNMAEM